ELSAFEATEIAPGLLGLYMCGAGGLVSLGALGLRFLQQLACLGGLAGGLLVAALRIVGHTRQLHDELARGCEVWLGLFRRVWLGGLDGRCRLLRHDGLVRSL